MLWCSHLVCLRPLPGRVPPLYRNLGSDLARGGVVSPKLADEPSVQSSRRLIIPICYSLVTTDD